MTALGRAALFVCALVACGAPRPATLDAPRRAPTIVASGAEIASVPARYAISPGAAQEAIEAIGGAARVVHGGHRRALLSVRDDEMLEIDPGGPLRRRRRGDARGLRAATSAVRVRRGQVLAHRGSTVRCDRSVA